jgi:hypothetical protein
MGRNVLEKLLLPWREKHTHFYTEHEREHTPAISWGPSTKLQGVKSQKTITVSRGWKVQTPWSYHMQHPHVQQHKKTHSTHLNFFELPGLFMSPLNRNKRSLFIKSRIWLLTSKMANYTTTRVRLRWWLMTQCCGSSIVPSGRRPIWQ